MQKKETMSGFGIVVLSRGWVYVGNIDIDDKWCVITDAKNIRRWGTTKGIGELALDGPKEGTQLDPSGTVRILATDIHHMLDSEADKWKS